MSTEDCWQEQAAARGPQLSFSKGSGHLHKLHSSLPARSISTWCYSADISDQRKYVICTRRRIISLSKSESALTPSPGQAPQQQLTNSHCLNDAVGCHFIISVVINKFKP